jgi:hypothetical protein
MCYRRRYDKRRLWWGEFGMCLVSEATPALIAAINEVFHRRGMVGVRCRSSNYKHAFYSASRQIDS